MKYNTVKILKKETKGKAFTRGKKSHSLMMRANKRKAKRKAK